MVESIANIVRAWPAERIRNGQPYLALELICGVAPANGGPLEMEWSINIRCEPQSATALDGAISATYPDVRLGRIHGEQPLPRPGVLREPGYVMRFRKERSFVYSLIADGEEQASAPLEQIARAQVAVAAPTVVRFQLTPTPVRFEALARRLYRRHENKLVRQERWGLPGGRADIDVQPRRDARRRAHPEPKPVLARDRRRGRHPGGVQDGRRRRPVQTRREPPSPPLDDRPPAPVPPPLPAGARAADPIVAIARLGRRGRAPARAALRADEGRPGTAGVPPADPRPARSRPWPPGARTCSTRRPTGTHASCLSPAHHPALKGDPHMSQDDYPGRDATPQIPHLPAPPTIMRGRRPRRVPSSGTLQAAARARAQLPAGSRRRKDTSRRPREAHEGRRGSPVSDAPADERRGVITDRKCERVPASVSERRRTRRGGHDEAHEGRRGSPVSDAAGRQRRGGDLPLGPQVRGAADRRPGMRQDLRAALLLPQRHRGRERRADRDRPQVRALAHLPAGSPRRTAANGSGSSTSAGPRSG